MPIVRALPEEITLVGGISGRRLRTHPEVDALLRDRDAFGVPGGARGLDDVVVGCGPRGCVALGEGALDHASLRAHGKADDDVQRVRVPGGLRVSLVRLGDGKAIAGDRAAVGDLRRRWRAGGAELTDGAWLRGLVPDGEVWFAAREPLALHADAGLWLERVDLAEARAALDALDAMYARFEVAAAHVEAVAVSASAAREQVVLRVRARDASAAIWAAGVARARLVATPLPDGVHAARVVQRDRLVELQVDVALAPLIDAVSKERR